MNFELGIRSFSELGVRNYELGVVLGFACDYELFSYELFNLVFYSSGGLRPPQYQMISYKVS